MPPSSLWHTERAHSRELLRYLIVTSIRGKLRQPDGTDQVPPTISTAAARRGIEGRTSMAKKPVLVLTACLLLVPRLGAADDTKAVLDGVSKAMGEVKSLQYSGSGAFFSL